MAQQIIWTGLGQEEVQDHLNDAEKSDICPIDILSHYWKYYNGKLMLRITGLYGLSEEPAEAEYLDIDYPDTLSPYLLGLA